VPTSNGCRLEIRIDLEPVNGSHMSDIFTEFLMKRSSLLCHSSCPMEWKSGTDHQTRDDGLKSFVFTMILGLMIFNFLNPLTSSTIEMTVSELFYFSRDFLEKRALFEWQMALNIETKSITALTSRCCEFAPVEMMTLVRPSQPTSQRTTC
jgi:hypothetical protein